MVVDTGGGEYSTITDSAWHVLSNTNHSSLMSGHQSEHEQVLSVVNAVTKAYIEGRDEPVLFVMHYAALVVDERKRKGILTRTIPVNETWCKIRSDTKDTWQKM